MRTPEPTLPPEKAALDPPRPSLTAVDLAEGLVEKYLNLMAHGEFEIAWTFLAKESQEVGYAAFAVDRAAFFKGVQRDFEIQPPRNDEATLMQWREAANQLGISLDNGYIVQVNYPRISASTNANFEVYFVGHDENGELKIWLLR